VIDAQIDRELLSRELDRAEAALREELGRAGATALSVAGVVATLAGVGLAVLLAGDWTPAALPAAGRAAWWAGSAATLVALAALASVVIPKIPPVEPDQPPVYWGAILGWAGNIEGLAAALADLLVDLRPRVTHAVTLAAIVARKWRHLRIGLITLTAAVALLVLAGLAGLVSG
jgi:hypothetical protein